MAKRKVVRRKKTASRANQGINIDFHSWTFFIFSFFVLLVAILLVLQQKGIDFLRIVH